MCSRSVHRQPWYVEFFSSPASLWLGAFPDQAVSQQEAQQIAELIELRPGLSVADVPCGPGRHLVYWARMGCRVVGVDISPMMIERAKALVNAFGVEVLLVRGCMERLPLQSCAFDAILSLFNSFGYLPDDEANAHVVKEAARVLKPMGIFLLDTRNPVVQILCAPYGEEVFTPDGRCFVARASYDLATKRLNVRWDEVGTTTRFVASIRLYSLEELTAMFHDAGLSVEGVYGDFHGRPFDKASAQMILVGRKR
ncbi:MAG: methyltransferase domain-containing protein [Armatimonadetes bacterium]|nr:methyltransferase domain-containing protein [Armatimonadota bacterium]